MRQQSLTFSRSSQMLLDDIAARFREEKMIERKSPSPNPSDSVVDDGSDGSSVITTISSSCGAGGGCSTYSGAGGRVGSSRDRSYRASPVPGVHSSRRTLGMSSSGSTVSTIKSLRQRHSSRQDLSAAETTRRRRDPS